MKVKSMSPYVLKYGYFSIGPYVLCSAVANVLPGKLAFSQRYFKDLASEI